MSLEKVEKTRWIIGKCSDSFFIFISLWTASLSDGCFLGFFVNLILAPNIPTFAFFIPKKVGREIRGVKMGK